MNKRRLAVATLQVDIDLTSSSEYLCACLCDMFRLSTSSTILLNIFDQLKGEEKDVCAITSVGVVHPSLGLGPSTIVGYKRMNACTVNYCSGNNVPRQSVPGSSFTEELSDISFFFKLHFRQRKMMENPRSRMKFFPMP